MKLNHYSYRITWSEQDKQHVGLCAEFPGLSWLSDTPEDALSGIRKLVREALTDMQANKEPIPEAISTRKFSGKFLVRVPPETHRMLTLQAADAGVSLNRLISSKLS